VLETTFLEQLRIHSFLPADQLRSVIAHQNPALLQRHSLKAQARSRRSFLTVNQQRRLQLSRSAGTSHHHKEQVATYRSRFAPQSRGPLSATYVEIPAGKDLPQLATNFVVSRLEVLESMAELVLLGLVLVPASVLFVG
jgi:hypothetical protein